MLSKDDLILAQLISSGLPENIEVKASGIIAGLNEVSYAVSPYAPTALIDQAMEVTRNLTPHNDVMELATTEMAKVVRGAFDMVKTYGVPMALAIADGVSCLYSMESVLRTIRSELDIKYINVDDPLFNLGIYPVQVANKSLSFESVNFGMLERLKFGYVSDSDLVEWVNSKHPEIVAVLEDKSTSTYTALWNMTSPDGMRGVFKVMENGQINFADIRTIDVPLLMKMFVIASKMFMTDKPVPWLEEGSLEDYREFTSLIWNGISRYLIGLKHITGLYRAREMVITDVTPVRYKEITPHEALGVKVNVVEGKVLVFYTGAIMRAITESGTAISDVTVAYLYSRVKGKSFSLSELANNKLRVSELMSQYVDEVSGVIHNRAKDVFCESAAIAIAQFIDGNQAAKEALYTSIGEKGSMTATVVRQRLGAAISKLYSIYSSRVGKNDELVAEADGGSTQTLIGERKKECINIILSTDIVPVFLNLLGCNMAAAIIAATYVTQDKVFTAVDERKQLHCALIQVMANLSLE
jgi:hypothetical protein